MLTGALGLATGLLFMDWANKRKQIAGLQEIKHQSDMLQTALTQTVACGGWLNVMHNGRIYPVGVLLDKLEPVSDKVQ